MPRGRTNRLSYTVDARPLDRGALRSRRNARSASRCHQAAAALHATHVALTFPSTRVLDPRQFGFSQRGKPQQRLWCSVGTFCRAARRQRQGCPEDCSSQCSISPRRIDRNCMPKGYLLDPMVILPNRETGSVVYCYDVADLCSSRSRCPSRSVSVQQPRESVIVLNRGIDAAGRRVSYRALLHSLFAHHAYRPDE